MPRINDDIPFPAACCCCYGGSGFSVDSNVLEKKQWHLCRLECICVWKLGFYIANSINGGIDMYGAMACVCWIVNFSVEDVRRPDNGSKTLSELKFQVTLCSYEITDFILFLGIWY